MFVADNFHSYFDTIKSPMDLSTMSVKLEQGKYHDRFAFEADFKLMIDNAKRYNMPGSVVYNEATSLDSFFDKRTCLTVSKPTSMIHRPPYSVGKDQQDVGGGQQGCCAVTVSPSSAGSSRHPDSCHF